MTEIVIYMLISSILIPFWLFIIFSILSILKSIFDHVKKFDNPLKIKKGVSISFTSSLLFSLIYFVSSFTIYYSNQLIGFVYFADIPYYTGITSLIVTIYYYQKRLRAFGKRRELKDIIKRIGYSIRNVWK